MLNTNQIYQEQSHNRLPRESNLLFVFGTSKHLEVLLNFCWNYIQKVLKYSDYNIYIYNFNNVSNTTQKLFL